jgi:hypothetical protein
MSDSSVDSLHQVALLASGKWFSDSERGARAVHGEEMDWPGLILLAQKHGLGPSLLANLQTPQNPPIDEHYLSMLQAERAEVAVHFFLAADVQRKVEAAFAQTGVRGMWLKGIVLAMSVYPSPELRPMVDIDVLVPYDQRERALAAVEGIGYATARPQLFDGRDGLKHHYYLQNRSGPPISLELHFRLIGALDRLLSLEDQSWFWQQTMSQDLPNGDQVTVPHPESHLLYLCAHAILQHGEADLRLLRYYDIDRLVANTEGFDWDLFVDGATQLRWTYAAQRGLELAQEYFRTVVPTGLLSELTSVRPETERESHARRRQKQRTTTQTVIDDLAAMSWSDRVRAASRIVMPPPGYMRWRYGLSSNRDLPGAYLRRVRRIGSDILVSMRHKRKIDA